MLWLRESTALEWVTAQMEKSWCSVLGGVDRPEMEIRWNADGAVCSGWGDVQMVSPSGGDEIGGSVDQEGRAAVSGGDGMAGAVGPVLRWKVESEVVVEMGERSDQVEME